MVWKAMAPAEVCDVMDVWASQSWPLNNSEVHRVAIERLGWSEDEDGDLVNVVSGLTIPDVFTVASGDQLASLEFRVTDVIREVTSESTEFLGDRFALLVREGSARWGKPSLSDSPPSSSAQWDLADGTLVRFARGTRSVAAEFETPQTAERERVLGDR